MHISFVDISLDPCTSDGEGEKICRMVSSLSSMYFSTFTSLGIYPSVVSSGLRTLCELKVYVKEPFGWLTECIYGAVSFLSFSLFVLDFMGAKDE